MIKYESFSVAPRESSVLYWWKKHATLLPILAKIARSILVIPASSAKSERVFSTGGNTVAVKRTRLNPLRVEHLIVIKENLSKLKEFELFHEDYNFRMLRKALQRRRTAEFTFPLRLQTFLLPLTLMWKMKNSKTLRMIFSMTMLSE